MPESKAITKKEETTTELFARLKRDYLPKERERVEDLPRWVKTALTMKAVLGGTWKDAAERCGKKPDTLRQYAKSPAAKEWLGDLEGFLEDPVELAKAFLRGNALSVTVDRVVCLDQAIAAGDYKAADAIAKDIQEKLGIVSPKTKAEGPAVLNITIGSGAVEVPAIEATWEEVKDEEDE